MHLFVVSSEPERLALRECLDPAKGLVVTPGMALAGQGFSGYTLLCFLGKREREWFVQDVRTRIEPKRA